MVDASEVQIPASVSPDGEPLLTSLTIIHQVNTDTDDRYKNFFVHPLFLILCKLSSDCSERVCPSHIAWSALPNADGTSHTTSSLLECSDRGVCDRATGLCKCFDGYTGSSCQRSRCLNDCSGHGFCTSMERYARTSDAMPLTDTSINYGDDATDADWDAKMIYVCHCDSSWDVGLGSGKVCK